MPIPWPFSSTKDAAVAAESRDATPDSLEATVPMTPALGTPPAEVEKGLKRTHDQMYDVLCQTFSRDIC